MSSTDSSVSSTVAAATGLSTPTIAGIAIGAAALVALVLVCCCCGCCCSRRGRGGRRSTCQMC